MATGTPRIVLLPPVAGKSLGGLSLRVALQFIAPSRLLGIWHAVSQCYFAHYLSYAELHLQQGSANIASAEYWLRNKGGLSLTKWTGVKSKMTPVVEELLAQYRLN